MRLEVSSHSGMEISKWQQVTCNRKKLNNSKNFGLFLTGYIDQNMELFWNYCENCQNFEKLSHKNVMKIDV